VSASPSPDCKRSALISGGHGDLAIAIAQHLEQAGWSVLAPGRQELDVSREDCVREFCEELLLPIELLVHNAGSTRDGPVSRMTSSQWNEVVDVHVTGAWRLTRALLPGMLRNRRGHVVSIGSYSALQPPIGQSNYASAKAALIGFTKSLAREYGARNIRANCILPGFLETKMTADLSPAVVEAMREQHALGRFNTPDDVARFLGCLDSLEHVSGQVFQLDSRIRPWT